MPAFIIPRGRDKVEILWLPALQLTASFQKSLLRLCEFVSYYIKLKEENNQSMS